MTQYIDKSALAAEIEKLKDEAKIHPSDFDCGRLSICKELMNFLDTLEVKEDVVLNDTLANSLEISRHGNPHIGGNGNLEEAASQYPSVICQISPQWKSEVENVFKAGAEWQKEQMMKDAVYGLVCGHDESSPAWIDLNLLNKPNVKVGTEVKLIIIKDE